MVYFFESVGLGHPDRLANVIADLCVDYFRKKLGVVSVAVECLLDPSNVYVSGEVGKKGLEILDWDKRLKYEIYTFLEEMGYQGRDFQIHLNLRPQSEELNQASYSFGNLLPGDQSVVMGYACEGSHNLFPEGMNKANELINAINEHQLIQNCLQDAKVMIKGSEDGREVYGVTVSCFSDYLKTEHLRGLVEGTVEKLFGSGVPLDLNVYNSGGLYADTGANNRKLICDAYGPGVQHGGGGLSGKDLTKVDRLGFYYARWVCKCLVASGLFRKVRLMLCFELGNSHPIFNIMEMEPTLGKGGEVLGVADLQKLFPYSYYEIFNMFDSYDLKLATLSRYGHFQQWLPWEKTVSKAGEIKEYMDKIYNN